MHILHEMSPWFMSHHFTLDGLSRRVLTESSFFLWTVVGAYPSLELNAMVMALFSTDELQEDYETL